jgi:hypothetical protein
MPNQPLSNWTKRLRRNEIPVERRAGHGSSAWAAPVRGASLRQPQDGAVEPRTTPKRIPAHHNGSLLVEPEDAGLTGGTRSLMRRLIGLNVANHSRPDRKAPVSALAADTFTQAA